MRVKNISKQVLPIMSGDKVVRLAPSGETDVVRTPQIVSLINSKLLEEVTEVLEVLDSRLDRENLDLLNSNTINIKDSKILD